MSSQTNEEENIDEESKLAEELADREALLVERCKLIRARAEYFRRGKGIRRAGRKKRQMRYKPVGDSYNPKNYRERAGGIGFPDDETRRFNKTGYIKVAEVF